MCIRDRSRVTENSTLISVLMTCSSAWMESALLDPNGGQRWVIYDEAWRLLSHPSLLRRMDAQWRLARHYGISNALVFHKLSDLDTVGELDRPPVIDPDAHDEVIVGELVPEDAA